MNMEAMKALDKDAYEWLEKMPPNTWCRAFFSEYPKCDVLLNNNCEVFNKYILEARELPILSMLERIKGQLMMRHYNKEKEMKEQWTGDICPKIRKKILKNAEYANTCYAVPAGKGIFQVQSGDFQYIVDIVQRHCDCRRWDLTGLPCSHAISCLRHERIPTESVVPDCYSVQAFATAYGESIWPCADKSTWAALVNGPEVLPPIYEKKVGRPPKTRKKQPHEVQGKYGTKMSKHGVEIHCRHCTGAGHNIAGCPLKKAGLGQEEATKKRKRIEMEELECKEEPVNTQPTKMIEYTFKNKKVNLLSEINNPMVKELMQLPTPSSRVDPIPQPLPECAFVEANVPAARPLPPTTVTKEGKAKMAKKVRKNPAPKRKNPPAQAAAAKKARKK
ncbi:unnamed protein product [Urochloa humidicola]